MFGESGKDPDVCSPTLRQYHKLLWSKALPGGRPFDLDDTSAECTCITALNLATSSCVATPSTCCPFAVMSSAEMPDIPVEAHLAELAEDVANVGSSTQARLRHQVVPPVCASSRHAPHSLNVPQPPVVRLVSTRENAARCAEGAVEGDAEKSKQLRRYPGVTPELEKWSGRLDSNSDPLRPRQAGAASESADSRMVCSV